MRIVIGLLEHIGDIVACEPVVRYLKKRHPRAEITWIVHERYKQLLEVNPHIDVVQTARCLTEWMFLSRHGKFDRVVDLHVNYRVCSCCQVPLIKATGNPHVNAFEWFDHGAILEAFSSGANLPRLSSAPRMYIQDAQVEAVRRLELGPRYCVIHRYSSSVDKDWADEKWARLIKWLDAEHDIKVVEVGHGRKPARRGYPKSYRDLIGQTTLLETAEVIAKATLFIGIDSGPAHFANANETPGVVLLGQLANFKKYNPFTGFYASENQNVRILQNLLGAAKEIEFKEVQEAVDYLLKINAPNGHLPPRERASDLPLISDDDIHGEEWSQKPASPEPQVLAFYLPQFHPIAENNVAHGTGFTEWTNVIRATPLFQGHYQPRLPGELGYYDLRAVDVIRRQIELALEYGITGFCFYYYYFAGKRLLFDPIQNFLDSDIDFPFCFLWANENWSKRWDGGDKEVIIEQQHSPNDSRIFIDGLLPVFADRRYIKVNGKPLLIVYKAHLIPDLKATTERWREEAKAAGYPDLYLVLCDSWESDLDKPRDWGFDAAYDIPANLVHPFYESEDKDSLGLKPDFKGLVVDYDKFASTISSRPNPPYKRFRTVMAPWDNTPRYGASANVYVNYKNSAFRNWITKAYLDTTARFEGSERVMFVHSWNEWCEGTYIEPDGKHGRFFLEQIQAGVQDAKNIVKFSLQSNLDLDASSVIRRIDRQTQDSMYFLLQATPWKPQPGMQSLLRKILPYSLFVKLRALILKVIG